ncbi:unnamed protein product, partial [Brenthis ino]
MLILRRATCCRCELLKGKRQRYRISSSWEERERGAAPAGRRSTRLTHAVTQSLLTLRREQSVAPCRARIARYVSYIETSLTGNS